ncbi:MAG: hypothetical protein KAQ78_11485, partial [Candidatus Latescibacteria bacterium]|nr:hypothetical protein [Candidatus Latescibacterota bacterium]
EQRAPTQSMWLLTVNNSGRMSRQGPDIFSLRNSFPRSREGRNIHGIPIMTKGAFGRIFSHL